ncbi:MAG: CAP domain-containing protein [Microgenomates group bacterium]
MKTAEKIVHLFIPRHTNNQKARLLHPQILILFVIKLMLLQIALQFIPASGLKILGYAANISPDEVIRLTNEKRVTAGLFPLEANDALGQAAQAKGADMLNRNYWAHVAPDGTQPWKFFIDAGYSYRYAGENLARDFTNPNSAVEAWMASPTHKDNLLSANYREIGIAVVEGDLDGIDTTIVVQFFGTKYADMPPAVPIAEAQPSATQEPQVTASPVPTASPTAVPVAASFPSPTPSPTSAIVAAPTPIQEAGPVGSKVLISPFSTTKGVSLVVVGLLLNVLVFDGLVARRRRIARIGGRTFAHLSFLGMILAIVLILRAGQVI